MEDKPLISVVIATYNGAQYLAAQLDSIYNQTYFKIEVIVCDDKSTDATVEILQEYEKRHGLRYYVNATKQGVVKNFESAIAYANGSYIALADQDDVWLPDKLELSLQLLQKIEKEAVKNQPVVVFTDLTVVDAKLNIMHMSYWGFMKLNPKNTQLNRVLVENVLTGCTLLMNRTTVNLAVPMPAEALMHDVWLLLVASCFGSVGYLREPTVLYRQHSQNVVGAQKKNILKKIASGYTKLKQNRFSLLLPEIEQAKSFYNRYSDQLLGYSENKAILEAFISLKNQSVFKKKYVIWKHAFYGSTYKKALNILLRA